MEGLISHQALCGLRPRRLIIVLCTTFFILVHISRSWAAPQLDQLGLLPPIRSDQSPIVGQIRKSLLSGNLALMKKDVEELIRSNPRSYEGYFWLGFLDLQLRNDYEAVRALRHAEALDANSYVLKLLAVTYYSIHQFQLFTLTMNRAIQKNPKDFAPYYYLGRYYATTDMSDFDKAAEYFRHALQLDSQHLRSRYYLGYCYEVQRKLGDAEKEYQRSMELAKDDGVQFSLPYEGMARLRLLQSKPSEALEYAKKAVEFAPNDVASHTVLAKVYGALGQQAEAIPEWKRVAELDQTDAIPYYRLFQIYSALGMKEKAGEAMANFKRLTGIYGTQ
jgi:tetratricopeptide (TPR) repeat protein